MELHCDCVTMLYDLRTTIALGQRVIILEDRTDVGNVNGVRIPRVFAQHNELLRYILEHPVLLSGSDKRTKNITCLVSVTRFSFKT